jgi:hypothetical protein
VIDFLQDECCVNEQCNWCTFERGSFE